MKTSTRILFLAALLGLAAFVPIAGASTGAALVGQTVTFSVTSDGDPPFTYQWRKGGAIIDATAQTYVIASVILADAGVYTVTVSNSAGSVLSDTATLTVTVPVAPPTHATTTVTTTTRATTTSMTTTTTTKPPGT